MGEEGHCEHEEGVGGGTVSTRKGAGSRKLDQLCVSAVEESAFLGFNVTCVPKTR